MSGGLIHGEGRGFTSLDKYYKSNCNSIDFFDDFKKVFGDFKVVEVKEKGKKKYCGNYSIVGKSKEGVGRVIKHRCKTWGCAVCGPKKLKKVSKGIYKAADTYELNRFITLTLPADYKGSYQDSVIDINKIWSKFRVYLERKHGDSIKFIKIVEKQKRGVAHLHVLVDRFIKQAWISEVWSGLGGGKIVDIRYVYVHMVSSYFSKYMTKEMLSDENGSYRRYGTSQGIKILEKVKKDSDFVWSFKRQSAEYLWYFVASPKLKSCMGKVLDFFSSDGGGEVSRFTVDFAVVP